MACSVAGTTFDVMEYDFFRDDALGVRPIQAYDVLLLPGSGPTVDMGIVSKRSTDYRRKNYGAAQIQIVFDGETEPAVRDATCRMLLEIYWPLIQTVLNGVTP